ncbi:MAG: uncharacterized protein QOJ99_506 [Bryobacterales bacterium]|jgi:hypothetical protein|nr:uncharacterized protein [Bryobacterales bacterium]
MINITQIRRLPTIAQRIESFNWDAVSVELDACGAAIIGPLLSPDQCKTLISGFDNEELYRSRVVMARHGFGRGEYKYIRYALPSVIAELRESLYGHLAEIANRWNEGMGIDIRYPAEHEAFKARCHEAGQTKPTPLILKYGAGDYNCLHQDIYGEHVFPLQIAFLLSKPNEEFTGGEFTLTEQRPRMQSRVEVVPLGMGMGVIFPVHHRPVKGIRGTYRVSMRHGVSRVRSGQRFTMGVIFHDAK